MATLIRARVTVLDGHGVAHGQLEQSEAEKRYGLRPRCQCGEPCSLTHIDDFARWHFRCGSGFVWYEQH